MCSRVRERVAEQKLGELALPEGHDGWVAGVGVVGLHLHALAKVHERLVDLACLRQSCAGRFGSASTLGTCKSMSIGVDKVR